MIRLFHEDMENSTGPLLASKPISPDTCHLGMISTTDDVVQRMPSYHNVDGEFRLSSNYRINYIPSDLKLTPSSGTFTQY